MNGGSREHKVDTARTRLAELAVKFLDRSQADLAAMRAALKSGDAASMARIHQLAHRMVGTGATLGFEPISDCAARIEDLAEACGGAAAGDDTRARLSVELAALDAEFQRARGA